MPDGLSDTQIIRLHRDLIAPLAVHDMLTGKDVLDETARYTLDVMIAEYEPDTALLCIALSAAHIAHHASFMPVAGALGFEASRIVHEIGPWWLAHADGKLKPRDEDRVLDILDHMPEDFEAMGDLLMAVRANLVDESPQSILCDILAQNAIAFMDALNEQAEEERILSQRDIMRNLETFDNVIIFPRMTAQQRAALKR
jgi:hypothetical protein